MAETSPLHVLIAFDGSSNAGEAVRAAGRLFPGARAGVVFAAEDPPIAELVDAGLVEAVGEFQRALLDRARERAEDGRRLAESAGLQATASVASGPSAWRGIARAAEDLDVDAIVCGSRGHGPCSRAVLGSVSSALLHHAGRPVLVVPGGSDVSGGPTLIAYDGSPGSRDAIAAAARLVPGRPAVVAHAWDSPLRRSYAGEAIAAMPLPEAGELIESFQEMLARDGQERAEEGAALAEAAGLAARAVAIEAADGTWRALAAVAGTEGAAVLVAGSRGRGALTSTVLGSVSASLAHNAELPVLIVP